MSEYKNEVLVGCTDLSGKSQTPAHSNLLDIRSIEDSPLLADEDRERFYSVTAQLLYLAKRVRPDLLVAVSLTQGNSVGRTAKYIKFCILRSAR